MLPPRRGPMSIFVVDALSSGTRPKIGDTPRSRHGCRAQDRRHLGLREAESPPRRDSSMASISRRQVVRGGAAAVGMTLSRPSVHAQTGRQTLRFVAHAELKTLDPVWQTAYITRNHGYLVYDTLFGTDEHFQVKPQMVDQATMSPDGMKYAFTLP